jgi:hypothetical protein
MERESTENRKRLEDNASAYMMFGDVDKPFHRPECECDICENWRAIHNRPTHKELRNAESTKNR